MEGFGSSASGYSGQPQYGQSQYSGGGAQGGYSSASASSGKMVGFGSDGRSFQQQQQGGSDGGSGAITAGFSGQDVSSAVSSAVGNLGGILRSQFSGTSSKEVRH